MRAKAWFLSALLALLSACGGGEGGIFDSCTPPPSISSTPQSTATVGQEYVYGIHAIHLCGGIIPFPCRNVDALRLPAGATFSDTQAPYILWTPSPSQANSNAAFEIATKPDSCGDRVTQSWTVYVTADTTPPALASKYPSAQTDVPLTTSIGITFSEPIDANSIDLNSFIVTGPAGPIPGSIATYTPATATFHPTADLPASSSISITLTTAIKDLSGNALTSNYTWTFTTAAIPPAPPPGWTWATVVSTIGVAIRWTSLALDSSDHVYIASQDEQPLTATQQRGSILLSTNVSGSWLTTTIDSVAPTVYSSISSLVNTDATVHIGYYDFTRHQLKHATNESGSWLSEIVDPNALNVTTVLMTHDVGSHIHLIYNPDGAVAYATNATGAWAAQPIGSINAIYGDATTAAIAIDPPGNIHVAYYDSAAAALKHVTNTSGTWETETVDSQGDVGLHVSIASDSSGNMHISYYDASNGHLKYATNSSGAWVSQTVDGVGDVGLGTGVALDSLGHAHISYTDATTHALRYATNASGPWRTLIVDDTNHVGSFHGNNGYTSIAIDSTDKVHISYVANSHLRYATNK
jgi:hypothetical protein